MIPALAFSLVYLLPILVVLGHALGGWFNYLAPAAAFGAVPLADLLVGRYRRNPDSAQEATFGEWIDYRLMTWPAAPVQVALVVWGAHVVTHAHLAAHELIGFVWSIGVTGGVMGINLAHELVHKHNRWERFLGNAMLWTVGYMHWGVIEHVAGHHKNVATPGDPATARWGETFYRFWPRTVWGSLKSAWGIERARLARQGKPAWSWRNRLIRYEAMTAILVATLGFAFGFGAVVFWAIQAILAFSLLEIVNYLEHYALLRAKRADGTYERVSPEHSWNASELITNLFLLNLQRHSDHHYKPARRYQILRHQESAPQLPTGYAGMVLLAALPPLWFRVMNPRVPEVMRRRHTEEFPNAT